MGNQKSLSINYYIVVKMDVINGSDLMVHYIDGNKVVYQCESEKNAKKEIDKLIVFAEGFIYDR